MSSANLTYDLCTNKTFLVTSTNPNPIITHVLTSIAIPFSMGINRSAAHVAYPSKEMMAKPRRESHLPKSIHTPIFAPTSRIRTTKTDGTSVSPKLLTSVTVVSPPASTTKQETALESVESPPSPKSPAREIDHPHILHLSPIYTQNQISDAIDLSNHELASHPEQIVTVNLPTNDSLEHTLSQHRPHLELMHINHKGKKTRKPKRPKEDSQMRMHHLCHYNPRKPIKEHKSKSPRRKKSIQEIAMKPAASPNVPESEAGPQLQLIDGEIVVNPESLEYVPTSHTPTPIFLKYDADEHTTSSSYSKRAKPIAWTASETTRFFEALSCCGTDFSLMQKLFPRRSLRQLKKKFTRENKRQHGRVSHALRHRKPLTHEALNQSRLPPAEQQVQRD
eukprot:gene2311-5296_t